MGASMELRPPGKQYQAVTKIKLHQRIDEMKAIQLELLAEKENATFTPDQKLLGLSWKQPYAQLMMYGKIETRTWETKYRGWVLICASKKAYNVNQVQAIAGERQLARIVRILVKNISDFLKDDQTGIAIGIGRLIECRPMRIEDEDKCFVKFSPSLYCHIYKDVKRIKPINIRGAQRWKQIQEEIKQKIEIL
jgi:hypothetical protein